MRIPYYFGWILLAGAFASAAAEVLVKSSPGGAQFFVAAHDLWYTIWPSSLVIFQIRLENISPALWDPWALGILAMPAWALLGTPGFLCIGLFRPRKPNDWRELEEARKHEEQLMLYDELAREAKTQGMDADGDDMQPDHSGHEAIQSLHEERLDDEGEFDRFIRDAGFEPKENRTTSLPDAARDGGAEKPSGGRPDSS